MVNHTTHVPAGSGPHQLVIGSVVVSRLLGGEETDNQLSLVDLKGLPGSGPGAHMDPWCETFYVLEGELTFRFEQDDAVSSVVAEPGDAVTIPAGVPHAFSVTGSEPARYLIIGTAAGIDSFFADAGEPVESASLPHEPLPFDRDRLRAAFAKHGLIPHTFPAEHVEST
jgi:quercetin dioxygenase-like cupin family protein